MKKCNSNYSIEALAEMLAASEFEENTINFKDEEIEFDDSIVFVSGSIFGIRDRKLQPPYDNSITEIVCIFEEVIISYENQETKALSYDELKELETLTEKQFK